MKISRVFETKEVACGRCGGRGMLPEYVRINGGECYACGGSGTVTLTVRVYTPEEQAYVDARNAKAQARRDAQREVERAEREAEQAKREAERVAREAQWEAERLAKAQKSEYVGTVGQRQTFTAEVEFVVPFENQFGVSFLYGMRDEQGNRIVYFSASGAFGKGRKYTFSAGIKEHKEYKGEKQTVIQRATKIVEIEG